MAKIQIKSEKLTPFGGIFSIMEQFDSMLSSVIDSTLGLRCKLYGYQYSEIFRSLMCVYFCGGSCIEDVSAHLMKHLSLHPELRTCSADTILRAIEELTCENTTYTSDSGKSYDFNIADNMNSILTNDYESSVRDIVEFYNLRGGKERIFDDMNNGFGWNRLPKSFMAQNTVFLLMTAIIRNFYKAIIQKMDVKKFGLKHTSRIKTFVFKFISVPAKWIRMARQNILNVYTDNEAYANVFKTDFG